LFLVSSFWNWFQESFSSNKDGIPQRLKPPKFGLLTARLKPRPFKEALLKPGFLRPETAPLQGSIIETRLPAA